MNGPALPRTVIADPAGRTMLVGFAVVIDPS
jgi:hypothetical protein